MPLAPNVAVGHIFLEAALEETTWIQFVGTAQHVQLDFTFLPLALHHQIQFAASVQHAVTDRPSVDVLEPLILFAAYAQTIAHQRPVHISAPNRGLIY